MNKKRLTILRDALIEHAKNPGNLKFDLNSWASVPRQYREEDTVQVVRAAAQGVNYCGTTACAMGLAATLPQFKRLGLGLTINAFGGVIKYQGSVRDGFEVAEDVFEISCDDAAEIFGFSRYARDERKNPLAVADKITALLECA